MGRVGSGGGVVALVLSRMDSGWVGMDEHVADRWVRGC